MDQIMPDYLDKSSEDSLLESDAVIEKYGTAQITFSIARPFKKRKALKNTIVLGISFMLYFLGFQGLSNLQSTMNSKHGLGMDSQAVIYGFSMISSMFLPELLITKIGSKKTLVLMILCGCPYIASNYFPRMDVLITTSVIIGISLGPLSTAQAGYVKEQAFLYYQGSENGLLEAITARFFGLFTFFAANTQIWGNMISYFVLRPKQNPYASNSSVIKCGVEFILDMNVTNNSNLEPPTQEKRFILVSIYTCIALLAAISIALFIDPLENDVQDELDKGFCKSVITKTTAAIRHLKNTNQLLLLPLTLCTGLENGFYISDFTQAFIACSWGVHHVGFVTICFGVCGALMSIFVGFLVKYTTQISVLIFAAAINVTTCCMLFWWKPSPEATIEYFIFAGVWGMADAIWWSQIPALYGLMFPNDREAAFSNFFFWSNMGYLLCYSYANFFTVPVKINILICMLSLGILCYLIGQIKLRLPRRGYIVIEESE